VLSIDPLYFWRIHR